MCITRSYPSLELVFFTYFKMSFDEQKFLFLTQANLSIYYFIVSAFFWSSLRNASPPQDLIEISSLFYTKSIKVVFDV